MDDLEPVTSGSLLDGLLGGLRDAARVGLVEVWEAGVRDWRYCDALMELLERGPLPVRVRLLIAAGVAETYGMRARIGDPSLEVVGIKFYSDGWLGPRTCAMSSEFSDEPGNVGVLFQSPEVMASRMEPFANEGWLLATHAIGDRAIESVLDAYELVYGPDCRRHRPRIEHAQVLRLDLIDRMADMGVTACIQPSFGFDDASSADAALDGNFPYAYHWSELLHRDVTVVAGSDYPIAPLEPLIGLSRLLRNPFDEVTSSEAVEIMTVASAGTVTLSADPAEVDAGLLGEVQILSTAPEV